jgi:ribosomal protein L35AE/L33A
MSAATRAILAIDNMDDLKEAIAAINVKGRELQRYAANNFSIGNFVQFRSKTGKIVKGQIVKINQKTIKIKETNGLTTWTVSPTMLTRQGI